MTDTSAAKTDKPEAEKTHQFILHLVSSESEPLEQRFAVDREI